MVNYDPRKWAGLVNLDGLIAVDPKTGKRADMLVAVDEVARMVGEVGTIVDSDMQNVPESVRSSILLLCMATGVLAMIIRDRVVTEAIPGNG